MFRITIPLIGDKIYSDEELQEVNDDVINNEDDLRKQLLNIISENKDIKIKDIALKLRKSYKTIQRYLLELQKEGYIIRIGSKKQGFWKVIKSQD